MSSGMLTRALTLAAAILLTSATADSADHPVFGKRVLIKNPPSGAPHNKIVHLAKDPSITLGAAGGPGDPQCTGAGGGGTSSLRILAFAGAGDVTIPLPCSGWSTNATNSLYKYTDTSGATCKIVLVKNGVLAKAVCGGSQVATDLNGSMSPVAVFTTLNTERYCTEFGGTVLKDGSDEKTFLRKDAAAPASCPSVPCGYYLATWGGNGTGPGQFSFPFGIALDASGNVYITDSGNDRVQKFSSTGTFLTQWGTGTFSHPLGIAVDLSGDVFVVMENRVQKFTSDGTFLTEWGGVSGTGDGQFFDPTFIAVDAGGNVFVADSENQRVQKFTNTGTFLTKWGSLGSGNGQFLSVEGVAVDAGGNVFVVDVSNNRIQKFTNVGTFLTAWGGMGTGNGQFDQPVGITVDSNGDVYVADAANDRVQKFDNDGAFLAAWGTGGSGNGQLDHPTDVAVDGSGHLYVGDSSNHRIERFLCPFTAVPSTTSTSSTSSSTTSTSTTTSTSVTTTSTLPPCDFVLAWGEFGSANGQFYEPAGIATGPDGSVYVADRVNHRIQKFDPDGTFMLAFGSYGTGDGQFAYPQAVATDPSGNVYVADTYNHRIQKFDAAGTFLTKWGSFGSGPGEFDYAPSVTADSSGHVYGTSFSISVNYRIEKFDDTGGFIAEWTDLADLGAIATNASDNVYMLFQSGIAKYDGNGTLLSFFPHVFLMNSGAGGLTIDSSGNIYVAEELGPKIQKFDASGNFLTSWGSYGGGPGQFGHANGVALGTGGSLYVLDSYFNQVSKFSCP